MMKYEIVSIEGFDDVLKRTDDSGVISWIPMDESNSDYQAYLNPVEHLTEIPPQAALSTPIVTE